MLTIKNNDTICYLPTSARELKRLLIAYSIPCNIVKYLGKYDIVYCNRDIKPVNVSRISDLTLKQWLNVIIENLPIDLKQGEKGILYTEYIVKVNKSTI